MARASSSGRCTLTLWEAACSLQLRTTCSFIMYVHLMVVLLLAVLLQGNPLVPDDLRMVAASRAAVTCVVSDTSR
jgi:hypothetical protein